MFSGEVWVAVGLQSWLLRLDFRAMVAFEVATGKPALAWIIDFAQGRVTRAAELVAMCQAMLHLADGQDGHALAMAILDAHPDVLQRVIDAGMPGTGEADGAAAEKKPAPPPRWKRFIGHISPWGVPRSISGP